MRGTLYRGHSLRGALAIALAMRFWWGDAAHAQPAANQEPGLTARRYANTYGVSLDEAARRLARMAQAAELSARLSAAHPDRFAGLYIEHRPTFRVVVRATGDAAQFVRENAGDSAVVGVSAERSLRGLRQAQESILNVLQRLGVDFESSVDLRSGEIDVFVTDEARARPAVQALLSRTPFARLRQVGGMPQLSATITGGLRATGSTMTCTTGYNVANASGTRGILTAGHCNNTLTVAGVSLSFMGERYTGSYDLQWNSRSGHAYPNTAQIGEPYLMTVYRANAPVVGMYLCKYGITTGQTCGEVMDVAAGTREADGSTGYYVRVSDTLGGGQMNDLGDSGGPVFGEAGTAYGIVHAKGSASSAYPRDMYFMSLSQISVLSLTLVTTP